MLLFVVLSFCGREKTTFIVLSCYEECMLQIWLVLHVYCCFMVLQICLPAVLLSEANLVNITPRCGGGGGVQLPMVTVWNC